MRQHQGNLFVEVREVEVAEPAHEIGFGQNGFLGFGRDLGVVRHVGDDPVGAVDGLVAELPAFAHPVGFRVVVQREPGGKPIVSEVFRDGQIIAAQHIEAGQEGVCIRAVQLGHIVVQPDRRLFGLGIVGKKHVGRFLSGMYLVQKLVLAASQGEKYCHT